MGVFIMDRLLARLPVVSPTNLGHRLIASPALERRAATGDALGVTILYDRLRCQANHANHANHAHHGRLLKIPLPPLCPPAEEAEGPPYRWSARPFCRARRPASEARLSPRPDRFRSGPSPPEARRDTSASLRRKTAGR